MNRKSCCFFFLFLSILSFFSIFLFSCKLDVSEKAPKEYSVTWHIKDDSNSIRTEKVKENTKLSRYVPYKSGFFLDGWYSDDTYSQKWDFENEYVFSDLNLFAKWIANSTTIKIPYNNYQTSILTINYGDTATQSNDFSAMYKYGSTILGFYTEESGGIKVLNSDGSLASKNLNGLISDGKWCCASTNLSLYPHYGNANYKIIYKDKDGFDFSGIHEDGYPQMHTYGTTTVLDSPTKESGPELFLGWYTNIECENEGEKYSTLSSYFGLSGEESITLYAKWGVPDYLCFTAEEPGSSIYMMVSGSFSSLPALEYSFDKNNWEEFVPGATIITLESIGDKVYLRGDNAFLNGSDTQYLKFVMTGSIAGSGDVISLLDKTCQLKKVPAYCFRRLFHDCTSLTKAPNIGSVYADYNCFEGMFMGCTSMVTPPSVVSTASDGHYTSHCCDSMFKNCNSMTSAPKLQGGVHGFDVYANMFENCTALTSAPKLPAMSFCSGSSRFDGCYRGMFKGCSSLVEAPELPATILSNGCYSAMFMNCISLVSAPELPATTLTSGCYSSMFYGCSSLVHAPDLPATTLSSNCYASMFSGCISLETAPNISAVVLAEHCCDRMFKDCKSLIEAPILKASILTENCYTEMFYGCSSLQYIKVYAKILNDSACSNWVINVNDSGEFWKDYGTNWTRGSSACPVDWDICSITD